MSIEQKTTSPYKKFIIAASIAIPLVVAILFKVKITGVDLTFLPPIYAGINGLTAILLIIALIAIKNRRQSLHENCMKVCLILSLVFLACYVAYHMTTPSTHYDGSYPVVYYFILISHILLSIGVVPLVLFTYLFAMEGNYSRHKKYAKIAWHIWLYVALTGVVVYLLIAPYYK